MSACENFVKSTFKNREVLHILIKTNEKSVNFANKYGEAFKKSPKNTGCSPVGVQYYIIMGYAINAYCPEHKKVGGSKCKSYLEKVKKCYESDI
ncbi:hypothetical protein C0J52_04635 [Blattella germanica]|nr:hypothetical protein C0J52_04635 [Blattella germanica]